MRGPDEDRDAVDKLQRENARLSLLLEALGINKELQDSFPGTGGLSSLGQAVGEEAINSLQSGSFTSTPTVNLRYHPQLQQGLTDSVSCRRTSSQ